MCGAWLTLSMGLAEDRDHPLSDASKSGHAYLDQKLFGADRLHRNGFDPEGILGITTTALTAFLGSRYIQARLTPRESIIVGTGSMAAAWAWSAYAPEYVPLSKPYWTPSFTLFTAGFSILKYAAVDTLIPYLPNGIRYVLECLGQRSLEIYMVSGLLHAILRRFNVDKKVKGFLGRITGSVAVADLLFVGASNALMAYAATEFVEHGIRLRFPSW
jgi:predicted acyltransferase